MEFSSKLTLSQKALREKLHQIYMTSPFGIGGHFVVVLALVYLFSDIVPAKMLAIWALIQVVILLLRLFTVWRFFKIDPFLVSHEETVSWKRYYTLGAAATGLAWGLTIILFFHDVSIEYHFYLCAALLGLAGGGLVTLGSILSIYLAFMLPMLGISTVWFFLQSEKIYTITALMVSMAIFYYFFTARRYSLNYTRIIVEKERVIQSRYELLQRLSKAAELRDNDTGMHIMRMSKYCYLLSQQSGQGEAFSEAMLHASSMHDIGKIGISDNILLKPGKLTDEEFAIMETHAAAGKDILEGSESEIISLSESIAYTHHEKHDGTGYPRGLKGEEIPIEGRIVAICDVFDALVSDRPYKKAWKSEDAFTHIKEQAGKHFDPDLVAYFLEIKNEIVNIQKQLTD